MRKARLSNSDIEILKSWGEKDNDIEQIKRVALRCVYTLNDNKRIGWRQAYKILGQKTYLSGIDRASFHVTCTRSTAKDTIDFNASGYFWGE